MSESPEASEPAPLPVVRSEMRPVKAWKVYAVLFGVLFGSTFACVGAAVAYGFYLDYKSK